jgi:hypothetical protein
VSGEGTLDADRLMRLGPPRQISVARPFVELLSRTAPELADLLEYDGACADSGRPLAWFVQSSSSARYRVRSSAGRPAVGCGAHSGAIPARVDGASAVEGRDGNRPPRPWLGYALLAVFAAVALLPLSGRLHVGRSPSSLLQQRPRRPHLPACLSVCSRSV